MKVIIDIPKKEYDIIKSYKSFMSWTEGLIKKGVAIPDGVTNGDLIKAIFPDAEYLECGVVIDVVFARNEENWFDKNWWNAPYKG